MGRKTKSEKKRVKTLGASVVQPFEDEIIALGAKKERNKAWFSGRLLLRGYIAFLVDGKWEAEEVKEEALRKNISPEHLAIIEAQLKAGKDSDEVPIPQPAKLQMTTGRAMALPYIPNEKKGGRK